MKKLSPPDLSTLSHAQKDNLILALLERLDALESKVNKNSHNSSKPPSSDGLTKNTRSLREPSGKEADGQAGHQGTTLRQIDQPITQVVRHHLPFQCDDCHQPLAHGDAIVAGRRQVFEVPMAPCEVIEHHTLALRCSCTRRRCCTRTSPACAWPANCTGYTSPPTTPTPGTACMPGTVSRRSKRMTSCTNASASLCTIPGRPRFEARAVQRPSLARTGLRPRSHESALGAQDEDLPAHCQHHLRR